MPGEELRVDVAQEGGSFRASPPVSGGFPDPLSGDCVGWRLTQAACVGRGGRGLGRGCSAGPVLSAGEVAVRRDLGIEDDVGNLAGFPLMPKKREQLSGGATGIEVRQPYGDESAVPAPLVGIEVRRRPRPPPPCRSDQGFLVLSRPILRVPGARFLGRSLPALPRLHLVVRFVFTMLWSSVVRFLFAAARGRPGCCWVLIQVGHHKAVRHLTYSSERFLPCFVATR